MMTINSIDRRNEILQLLHNTGTVLVNELSQRFSVSEVTIRNDLRALEKTGSLQRFHGGATANLFNTDELHLEDRVQRFSDPKKRIALKAVSFVNEGDSIILDSGSTTMMIAHELVKLKNITVITNNLAAASILSENKDITLFVCGGTLRHKTYSMHGKAAEQSLQGISANIMFVGADGIDIERGITTFNEGYAISGVMANASSYVVAVLDSSKFGRSGLNIVLPLNQLNTIITDNNVDEKYRDEFQKKQIEFIAV